MFIDGVYGPYSVPAGQLLEIVSVGKDLIYFIGAILAW